MWISRKMAYGWINRLLKVSVQRIATYHGGFLFVEAGTGGWITSKRSIGFLEKGYALQTLDTRFKYKRNFSTKLKC